MHISLIKNNYLDEPDKNTFQYYYKLIDYNIENEKFHREKNLKILKNLQKK